MLMAHEPCMDAPPHAKPLSIRKTIALAIALTVASTMLGACALFGFHLYQTHRRAERLRTLSMAEIYAAQVSPLLTAGKTSELREYVNHLAWHPSTCLLAVLDAQNKPVAARGHTPLLGQYLTTPAKTAVAGVWNIPAEPAQSLPAFNMAACPILPAGSMIPIGTLLYAGRLADDTAIPIGEVWTFFALLIFVAAIGVLLAVWYLKQGVLEPLAALTHHCRSTDSEDHPPTEDRTDELGELARSLSAIRQEAAQWRQRVNRLEHSVDDRINAHTHKISLELQQAKRANWMDPLTKLGNRRLLDEKFTEIFRAQQDAGQELSLVMLDVDNFKPLNDTLGHKAGDEILSFTGELLRQCIREQDLAIRYGGDEFVLILPGVGAHVAHAIAERTIRLFCQQAKLLPVARHPAMSAGVASMREHRAASPANLIQLADQALYQAKRAGKGQVCIWQVGSPIHTEPKQPD